MAWGRRAGKRGAKEQGCMGHRGRKGRQRGRGAGGTGAGRNRNYNGAWRCIIFAATSSPKSSQTSEGTGSKGYALYVHDPVH